MGGDPDAATSQDAPQQRTSGPKRQQHQHPAVGTILSHQWLPIAWDEEAKILTTGLLLPDFSSPTLVTFPSSGHPGILPASPCPSCPRAQLRPASEPLPELSPLPIPPPPNITPSILPPGALSTPRAAPSSRAPASFPRPLWSAGKRPPERAHPHSQNLRRYYRGKKDSADGTEDGEMMPGDPGDYRVLVRGEQEGQSVRETGRR